MSGASRNQRREQGNPDSLDRTDPGLTGWEQPAARLREALEYDHLRLYAQPIVALEPPGGIALAEVLVRLREEEARMLPPGDFLPAFEHYRMMPELDRWVVRNALRHPQQGGAVSRLSINLSGQTLEEPAFVPFVAMQLRIAAIEPSAVVFEIDENDALDRAAAAQAFAAEMRKIGCGILLDGFARRSVTFEPLKALLANFVKVDGAIIRHVARPGTAAAKLGAIVRVGQVTGMGVIAECVEDEEVLAQVKKLGVGYVQGFGVRKPEPIEAIFGTG
jgi:EAL domain-containing protein (putative c-di-GMP-specific phosphodiesterase class I)